MNMETEKKNISDSELLEIFNSALDGTPLQYSSNLNPFTMFKLGYMAGQTHEGIVLPGNDYIKAHAPYFGKSCNKYWFEGAKWMKDKIGESGCNDTKVK